MLRRSLGAAVFVALLLACSCKSAETSSGHTSSATISSSASGDVGKGASPSTASPLELEVTAFDAKSQRFDVRAYNAGDKPIAQYELRYRYLDAAGRAIGGDQVRSWGEAGVELAPKQWSRLAMVADPIPPEAVKVEVRTTLVKTLGPDGRTYEPAFESRFGSAWPEKPR